MIAALSRVLIEVFRHPFLFYTSYKHSGVVSMVLVCIFHHCQLKKIYIIAIKITFLLGRLTNPHLPSPNTGTKIKIVPSNNIPQQNQQLETISFKFYTKNKKRQVSRINMAHTEAKLLLDVISQLPK